MQQEENRQEEKRITGYPSIDKPWLKYYECQVVNTSIPEGTMYDCMVSYNASRMNEWALNFFGSKCTYGQLVSDINRIAGALFQIGIRKGSIVATYALSTPECIISIYALNRIGAIADLQYVNLTPKEILENLRITQAKYILIVDVLLPVIESLINANSIESNVQIIVIPISRSLPKIKRIFLPKVKRVNDLKNVFYFNDLYEKNQQLEFIPADQGDEPALIVHTSGTTGKPKGVLLSNKNVNAIVVEYKNAFLDLKAGDTFLNIAPPFVAFGICLAIHTPLCLGLQVCLSPSPDPQTNGKIFSYYCPVHFLGGPAHIRDIISVLSKKKKDLSFVKTIGYGGESISIEDEEKYVSFFKGRGSKIEHLVPGYGMTEFGGTVVLTGNRIWKEESVGIPLLLSNIKIVDPSNAEELPYYKTGEIWMTSPSLMLGYYQNSDEYEQVMVKDEHNVRWLKTGDLGEIDKDGFLFLRGRIKRIYLTKGKDGSIYKLFPDYIERTIRESQMVFDCAVIAKSEDNLFYAPIVFIVVQDDNLEEISEYCEEHLPEYMVPKEFRAIEKIPCTATGKVDYKKLEKLT